LATVGYPTFRCQIFFDGCRSGAGPVFLAPLRLGKPFLLRGRDRRRRCVFPSLLFIFGPENELLSWGFRTFFAWNEIAETETLLSLALCAPLPIFRPPSLCTPFRMRCFFSLRSANFEPTSVLFRTSLFLDGFFQHENGDPFLCRRCEGRPSD